MKNNKGFTLTELLAIVVIIAIIAIISGPNMTKQISKSEEETKNVLTQNIENAAHIYAAKYYAKELVNGSEISFTLQDLVDDGLINLKDSQCDGKLKEEISIDSSSSYYYGNIEDDNCYKEETE